MNAILDLRSVSSMIAPAQLAGAASAIALGHAALKRAPTCIFEIDGAAIEAGASPNLLGGYYIFGAFWDRRRANAYLAHCFLGKWKGGGGNRSSRRRGIKPAQGTIRRKAERLSIALRWLELHQLADRDVNEGEIDRLGEDMEAGRWSVDGCELADSYIGNVQSALIDYLFWLEWMGLRGELQLQSETIRVPVAAPAFPKEVQYVERKAYVVVRRGNPEDVNYPSEEVVAAIIASIPDVVLRLIARLIFYSGLRAREAYGMPVSAFASVADQLRSKPSGPIIIKVVGKNKKRRPVLVDPHLARDILSYIGTGKFGAMRSERDIRLGAREELANGVQDTDALFVNSRNADPTSYRSVWKAIKDASTSQGFPLSPHLGRHWFALYFLLKNWRKASDKNPSALNGILTASRACSAPICLPPSSRRPTRLTSDPSLPLPLTRPRFSTRSCKEVAHDR